MAIEKSAFRKAIEARDGAIRALEGIERGA